MEERQSIWVHVAMVLYMFVHACTLPIWGCIRGVVNWHMLHGSHCRASSFFQCVARSIRAGPSAVDSSSGCAWSSPVTSVQRHPAKHLGCEFAPTIE
eukprot:1158282-Pelagomonas_calceolata.AAC.12